MSEFTACKHPDLPGSVANIATAALGGWTKLGWEPIGESLTPAQALAAEVEAEHATVAVAEHVPDLTVPEVLEAVAGDPEKAQAALEAELASDKPRTTLVAGLTPLAGQSGDPEGN